MRGTPAACTSRESSKFALDPSINGADMTGWGCQSESPKGNAVEGDPEKSLPVSRTRETPVPDNSKFNSLEATCSDCW